MKILVYLQAKSRKKCHLVKSVGCRKFWPYANTVLKVAIKGQYSGIQRSIEKEVYGVGGDYRGVDTILLDDVLLLLFVKTRLN